MARPVVTDLTPAQRASLAAMLRRDKAIAAALATPRARAGHQHISHVVTAREALTDLQAVISAGSGSLLGEGAEIPVALFLGSVRNAESSWRRNGLAVPAAAARQLAALRASYATTIAPARFIPLATAAALRARPA